MSLSPNQLRLGRKAAALTQQQAAARLGVSQAYLALLEGGHRLLTKEMTLRFVDLYGLPPTALPLNEEPDEACDSETVARDLAALGYPGFAHLRGAKTKNPASVLLAALSAGDLQVRLIEALPWLVLRFPDVDWQRLLEQAKHREIQNRLGFVVTLARRLAQRRPGEPSKLDDLAEVEKMLDRARLAREDTLCQQSLSEAERRWLRNSRPAEARHWNLLTDLTAEQLPYAA